jgi:hypothetical protein
MNEQFGSHTHNPAMSSIAMFSECASQLLLLYLGALRSHHLRLPVSLAPCIGEAIFPTDVLMNISSMVMITAAGSDPQAAARGTRCPNRRGSAASALAKPPIGMAPQHELHRVIDPALAALDFNPACDQRREARGHAGFQAAGNRTAIRACRLR